MISTTLGRVRRLQLVLVISSIFSAALSDSACALTLLVTDCSDGPSPGTLRNTIAAAPDNSIIQIPLMCSTITLDQGRLLAEGVTNMYIVGQGPTATIIQPATEGVPITMGRVFLSALKGTLGLSQLTLRNGSYVGDVPLGGCIYAAGSVGLNNAVVTGCSIVPNVGGTTSKGGGIYAHGSVTLFDSSVTNNHAYAVVGQKSIGGGIFAVKGVNAINSTISGNEAVSGLEGPESRAGGFYTGGAGSSVITRSTISGNVTDINSAAEVRSVGSSYSISITSSTIANNSSNDMQTIATYLPTTITNSTIAFNHAANGDFSTPAGIFVENLTAANNSIFSDNIADAGISYDITVPPLNPFPGSHNLITATIDTPPAGTLTACPRLGHLSRNGGPTQTIPLLSNSPALNVGAANGQSTDQRGTGFLRTVGAGTDIGAYERQGGVVDDVLFFSEFDSRCN